jgi:hypothetical protein
MNDNDFDLVARAWLDDGPNRMSDRALLSALEEVHGTRQRRLLWPAWRATPVNNFTRVAVAAVLVAAVGILAVNVVPRQPDGSSVGGPPTPSSTASPAPVVNIPLTSTFVSPTYGFSFGYHNRRGALTPATERWDPVNEPPLEAGGVFSAPNTDGFDVVETGLGAFYMAASTAIPEGVAIDDWIDAALASRASTPTCMVPRSRQAEITIDGQSGRISEGCANQFIATVVVDGRLDVFILLHSREGSDTRALFDDWIATIDLRPAPSPSPAASASPSTSPSASAVFPQWYAGESSGAGILAGGSQTTESFVPRFTFTVPEGWVNSGDEVDFYGLFPDTPANQAEFAASEGLANSIHMGPEDNPYFTCDAWEDNQGATAAEIAAALMANDALATSEPVDVTIGGLTGKQIDVQLDPGWTASCPGDTPTLDLGDMRSRGILLDTPDRGVIVIFLGSMHSAGHEAFLAEAMPIIESFQFDLNP